jgi:hypothetical protein
MSFIYNSINEKKGKILPYHKQPASDYYITHYRNYLILKFIWETEEDFNQKRSAMEEMSIAERKMDHWKKHDNWDFQEVSQKVAKLNREWIQLKPNIKFTAKDKTNT